MNPMRLKKQFAILWLFILYLYPSLFAQSMQSFWIDGDLSKIDSADQVKKVVLRYYLEDKTISDTSDVKNGKYHFEGQITENQLASLAIIPTRKTSGYGAILLDTVHMQAISESTFPNLHITGSGLLQIY